MQAAGQEANPVAVCNLNFLFFSAYHRHRLMTSCRGPIYMWSDAQARPSSAGDGSSKAAAQEAALAAVEEEWSGRLGEALALCQDQEAALEQLQRQSLKDRRYVFHVKPQPRELTAQFYGDAGLYHSSLNCTGSPQQCDTESLEKAFARPSWQDSCCRHYQLQKRGVEVRRHLWGGVGLLRSGCAMMCGLLCWYVCTPI